MPWSDLFLSSLLLPVIFLQFAMYLISEGVIFFVVVVVHLEAILKGDAYTDILP